MREQIKTACPLNCYDVCGLVVTIENKKIIKIAGDKEHPITQGKICGKGKMLLDRLNDSKRLLYPLKKIGNDFVRVSWDEALQEISEKMQEVKASFGPTAILHSYDYSSGGLLKGLDQRFFNFFGGFTEVIGSLCWGAGVQAQQYDMGNALSHDVSDIKNAKTIVVWGRNVTDTNQHLLPFLQEAKQKGTKLIVINPVKNGIAKLADTHIAIRPGMDGILALLVSKIIIEKSWVDRDFISAHSIGFEQFKQEVEQLNISEISKEIGVDPSLIDQLAIAFSQRKPVMTFLGLGMQRYANGGNTIRAIDALAAISGNIGISGGGVNYANLSVGRSFNWAELTRSDVRKQYRTFARSTQADEILNAVDPPIKMAFITRSNAVNQLPNYQQTIKALEQIPTKVVIEMFMTETAKMADYILPSAAVFEEEDIHYGSMFHGVIRYGPQIVEPKGEAWSDLKIWTELSKKLGLTGFDKSVDEFLELALKDLNQHGLDLAAIKNVKQFVLPIQTISWSDKKFTTPSGKFEFFSEQAKREGLSPTAGLVYPHESWQYQPELKRKYPYNLLSIHPTKSLHSQHHFFLRKKGDLPSVIISERVAMLHEIKTGDRIKLYNDRGEIVGKAKIQIGNQQDTILLEEGWSTDSGANANLLTANKLSDMGNGSVQYDCAVMIAKVKARD